ncbi:MAG: NAD-dependent epimerase/dehydratase family protein [Actinomycetales bacterium]
MSTWVIGAGGLLGRNVAHAVSRGGHLWQPGTPLAWDRPDTPDQLVAGLGEFVRYAAPGPWAVAWCAGAGVTATPQRAFEAELAAQRAFVHAVAQLPEAVRSRGALFLASSAGGLYAGSPDPAPYDEASTPLPLAPYGRAKLAAENLFGALAEQGVAVAVGRIANLYGAGQNLTKAQGLLTAACRSVLTGRPLGIYVPMDTLRDYLSAADAGNVIAGLIADVADRRPPGVQLKVIASGRAVTIASILGEVTRVAKRRPPVVLGASPAAAAQVRDLRLRSLHRTGLDVHVRTTLPTGVAQILASLRALQRSGVAL